jgi:hypothetical protein
VSQPLTFDINIDQNEYLPAGGSVMHAAISVTADGSAAGMSGPTPTAAQVIMIDCSTSMTGPKLEEAKRATAVAIDTLRDGVSFAVVAGNDMARTLYPPGYRMAVASKGTRADAKYEVARLAAYGGTAIGTWLDLGNALLGGTDAQIKHGILLSDGHNQHQTPEELRATLENCRDQFVCDCRGVGDGWEAKPLLEIADVLHGSAKGLEDPLTLAEEFQAITENLMGKAASNVTLRLWTLPTVRLRFLKQIYPRIVDLTDRGSPGQGKYVDYPTGQWGAETREFHLAVDVPVGKTGDDAIRVAKVSMVTGEHQSAERLVRARWTDNPTLSTKMNHKVAHLTGQAEQAEAIEEGVNAHKAGNNEVATARLGRAVQLAHDAGDEHTLKLLKRMVEIHDATTGTVQLRNNVRGVDKEMLAVESKMTARLGSNPDGSGDDPGGA